MATRKNFPSRVKARRKKALEQVMRRVKFRENNTQEKEGDARLAVASREKEILEKRIGTT